MWRELVLPEIRGPIFAVSVPADDFVAVWTEDGLFRVRLKGLPGIVRQCGIDSACKMFDHESGHFSTGDFQMIGECPPGSEHQFRADDNLESKVGNRVVVDGERVRVVDAGGHESLAIDGFDTSSPLRVAGFSNMRNDGNQYHYLVVCDSRRLRAFKYLVDRAGVVAEWQTRGGTSEQSALFAAVIADPESDAPRLFYADWLEEHGEPARAEFIRLQCEIAQRERTAYVGLLDPQRLREKALIAEHGDRWTAEAGKQPGYRPWSFWRGFSGAHVKGELKLTDPMQLRVPFDCVRLSDSLDAETIRRRYKNPIFARVRVLEVLPLYSNGRFFPIIDHSHLAGLRCLVLNHVNNIWTHIPSLVAQGYLRNLECLILKECEYEVPSPTSIPTRIDWPLHSVVIRNRKRMLRATTAERLRERFDTFVEEPMV